MALLGRQFGVHVPVPTPRLARLGNEETDGKVTGSRAEVTLANNLHGDDGRVIGTGRSIISQSLRLRGT